VEIIVCPEIPAREPHDNVVPHAKEPYEGKVGKGDDACSVGHEAEELVGDARVASSRRQRYSPSSQLYNRS
jgi:hypothetical protein